MDLNMVLAIFPALGLLALIMLVLVLDLLLPAEKKAALGWITTIGLLILGFLTISFHRPGQAPVLVWGDMLRMDGVSYIFWILFLFGAAITTLLSLDHPRLANHGEFYLLLLASTLGMGLMASAADIILLYLAIETTSIPLFVLAGFYIRDEKSVESGIKYMLYSAMASAVMLYGFSLLYGFSGTTSLYALAGRLATGDVSNITLIAALILTLVGFGFKISAAPFHFWAPDVYEGAPTQIAGFLSTASKAAGFAVLMRYLTAVFPDYTPAWTVLIAILSVASMFIGNLLALAQKNIKRLLAYSSIAQAGYMLIGVAAGTPVGMSAAIYYLVAYVVTNLAVFGVVMVVGRTVGSDAVSSYAGLSRRSPLLALLLLVGLLSLGGIPPFAGFIGKFLVLAAAVDTRQYILAALGIVNSVVGLYYYLVVLKVVYAYRSEEENRPISIRWPWAAALVVCALAILVVGVVVSPWLSLAAGAESLF